MSTRKDGLRERCTGNVSSARSAGPAPGDGPRPRATTEAEPGGGARWPTDRFAGDFPGDAVKNLYEELGVRNILLVEDDQWTRDSLSLFFQIEGCRLRAASNAAEAIAALSESRFDLIICE